MICYMHVGCVCHYYIVLECKLHLQFYLLFFGGAAVNVSYRALLFGSKRKYGSRLSAFHSRHLQYDIGYPSE